MRLLHLTEFYAGVGGLERGLHLICNELEKAGHVSSVAFADERGDEPRTSRSVHHLPGLAGAASPEVWARLKEVLEKEQPDVLMIHELLNPDVLDWLTARCPSVRHVWGFKLICPGGRRQWKSGEVCRRQVGYMCQAVAYQERCMPRNPRLGLPLIGRTLDLARIHRERSHLVVPSEFMRGLMLNEGFSSERTHKIPLFTVLPPADSLRPCQEPHTIFCAARLTPEKGTHLVLETLKSLPEAKLVVAGSGPERARLEAMAGEYGLRDRVTFTGWLKPASVAAHIAKAGIVVVPSVWPEPFGLIGIEAMARARPVVAFNVGGIREWLDHERTGLLVSRIDTAGLAEALARLLEKPLYAAELGRNGRAMAEERFTASAYLNALEPVLAAAVSQRTLA